MPSLTTSTTVAPESDRDRARRYKHEYDKVKSYVKEVDARSKQQDILIHELQQLLKQKDDQVRHRENTNSTQDERYGRTQTLEDTSHSKLQDEKRRIRELETVLAENTNLKRQLQNAQSELLLVKKRNDEKWRQLNNIYPLLTELQIEELAEIARNQERR